MTKSFGTTLRDKGLYLTRSKTTTLQVNVGLLCNLCCKHCHLSCGPSREEIMSRDTMDEVLAFAKRNEFEIIDITGGAPEMVPDIEYFINSLQPLAGKLIIRSNLTLLLDKGYNSLLECLLKNKVAIAASFPSANKTQANNQRGEGTWQKSIEALHKLNTLGYGMPDRKLELMLISNPTGAFMPPDQCRAEKKLKADLARKWGVSFTHLYTFANIPLGRFKIWLEKSGNLEGYMDKLAGNFNSANLPGLMCRSLISVSWDGYLFDCDFNQAASLPFNNTPTHVRDLGTLPEDIAIVTDNHCYGCTAGAGFT